VPGARTGAARRRRSSWRRGGWCGVAIRGHLAAALSGSTWSGLPRARAALACSQHAWVSTRSYARGDGHQGRLVWQRARRWGRGVYGLRYGVPACSERAGLG